MSKKKKIKEYCKNCKHTHNDLGIVAYHCDILYEIGERNKDRESKVRGNDECCFSPSKYERYTKNG